MNSSHEVLDGVMLGDASIKRSSGGANFVMASSGTKHTDFLTSVKENLEYMGIVFSTAYPKLYHSVSKGKHYDYYYLQSLCSELLSSYWPHWYGNGSKKKVPEDISLTPVSLAYWFMCDGSSTPGIRDYIQVYLATCAFSNSDIGILQESLKGLGIESSIHRGYKRNYGKEYPSIYINQYSVDAFMNLVSPHVLDSFTYKIKTRKGNILLGAST